MCLGKLPKLFEGKNCEVSLVDPKSVYSCFGVNFYESTVCSGHGNCVAKDNCTCFGNYGGDKCSTPVCADNCNGQGTCTGPNQCKCNDGFGGFNCNQFITRAACVSLPSEAKFCKDIVTYPIPYFAIGAKNKTHADQLFKNTVIALDNEIRITAEASIKAVNCTPDQPCFMAGKQLACYSRFQGCTIAPGATEPTSLPICLSTCNDLLAKIPHVELILVEGKPIYCEKFSAPKLSTTCNYGSFIPKETTCFGFNFTSPQVCSGSGSCTGPNICSCKPGFGGDKCHLPVCGGLTNDDKAVCGGNGKCEAPESCQCRPGLTGKTCEVPTCGGKTTVEGGCSFRGTCGMDGKCTCKSVNFMQQSNCGQCEVGYAGDNCELFMCHGTRSDDKMVCSGRGKCTGKDKCECPEGYSGKVCQQFTCYGIDSRNGSAACGGHGRCIGPNQCQCNPKYNDGKDCTSCGPMFSGVDCAVQSCDSSSCGGNGVCEGNKCLCSGNFAGETCERCKPGFVGDKCNIVCSAAANCSNHGECTEDGSCFCKPSFTGAKCDQCVEGYTGAMCDFFIDTKSFGFNQLGDAIIGTIRTTVTRAFDCKYFIASSSIASIGGTQANCQFNGKENDNLIIKLGPAATITPGDSITFFKNPSSDVETISILVDIGLFDSYSPNAVIIADKKVVSSCDQITMDASGSSSLDRRKLNFVWTVDNAPSTDAKDKLASMLVDKPHVFAPGRELAPGTYTVSVTVSSEFSGASSQASYSFTVISDVVPKINLPTGVATTFILGQKNVIAPEVFFPGCYHGNGRATFTYTFDESRSAAAITPKDKDGMLVFGRDFTEITIPGDYYFEVTATAENAQPASLSFVVTFAAQDLKVRFNVTHFSQSKDEPVYFKVVTSDPSQTNENEVVTTTCYDMTNSEDCNAVSGSKLVPGVYRFTATYTKGSRTSSENLLVTILDVEKSMLIRPTIVKSPPDIDFDAVDPSKDLLLPSKMLDPVKAPQYEWTSETLDMTGIEQTKQSYLRVPASLLSPGQTYTVKLSVVDGERSGSAELTFTVNSPPTRGLLEVAPESGSAFTTEFSISCGNGWSDVQTPMTFQFFFFDGSKWQPLNQRSETKSIVTSLPAGGKDGLKVKAVAWDSKGASSEVETLVMVTELSKDEALSALGNTTGTFSLAGTSSALSMLTSMTAENEEQAAAIQKLAASILSNYLDTIVKQDSITRETSDSAAIKISVMSIAVSSTAVLNEDVSKELIGIAADTVSNVAFDEEMSMDDTAISNVEKTLDGLVGKVEETYQVNPSRKVSAFSKSDMDKLSESYNNLLNIKDKTSVADSPANTVTASGMFGYSRKLNLPTLNNLEETLSGSYKFKLASNFGENGKLSSFSSVGLKFKVIDIDAAKKLIDPAVSTSNLKTKIIEFGVTDGTNAVSVSGSDLATLTFENVATRSTSEKVCYVYDSGLHVFKAAPATTCRVLSSNSVSVSSTGIYALGVEGANTPTSSTPETDHSQTVNSVSRSIPTFMLLAVLFALLAMMQ